MNATMVTVEDPDSGEFLIGVARLRAADEAARVIAQAERDLGITEPGERAEWAGLDNPAVEDSIRTWVKKERDR